MAVQTLSQLLRRVLIRFPQDKKEDFVVRTREFNRSLTAVVENLSSITSIRNISAARTLDNTDATVNCTANTFTITLPSAANIPGKVFNIKNSGEGIITLNTTGLQTIDGCVSGELFIEQYDNLTVQSTGSNWIII